MTKKEMFRIRVVVYFEKGSSVSSEVEMVYVETCGRSESSIMHSELTTRDYFALQIYLPNSPEIHINHDHPFLIRIHILNT